jgi:hypothetical protein
MRMHASADGVMRPPVAGIHGGINNITQFLHFIYLKVFCFLNYKVLKELIRLPFLVATRTIWILAIVSLTREKAVEPSKAPKPIPRTSELLRRAKTRL